ncbi:hypothetical protein [Sorangium sp. So ce1000]|uniref:hypothetical protein n=1 Tax=Sorangium sp. So ce1000 TaxID=3133325 RepID=UPI003F62C488
MLAYAALAESVEVLALPRPAMPAAPLDRVHNSGIVTAAWHFSAWWWTVDLGDA